jgi:hypothetical protein
MMNWYVTFMNIAQFTDQIRNRWNHWTGDVPTTLTQDDLIHAFALNVNDPADQILLHNLALVPSLTPLGENLYAVSDDSEMNFDPDHFATEFTNLNPSDLLSMEVPVVIPLSLVESFVKSTDEIFFLEKESQSCQDCPKYRRDRYRSCDYKLVHVLPQAPPCRFINQIKTKQRH